MLQLKFCSLFYEVGRNWKQLISKIYLLPIISEQVSQYLGKNLLDNKFMKFQHSGHPNSRDFIDAYINQRKKANEEQITNSSFFGDLGDMNYRKTMFDFFLAGSETTSTSLSFAILYMLDNPEPFRTGKYFNRKKKSCKRKVHPQIEKNKTLDFLVIKMSS